MSYVRKFVIPVEEVEEWLGLDEVHSILGADGFDAPVFKPITFRYVVLSDNSDWEFRWR